MSSEQPSGDDAEESRPTEGRRRWQPPPGLTATLPWLGGLWVLAGGVAAVVMTQASGLLAQVQSNEAGAYSMGSLVRPPLPFNDEQVRGAFQAWRGAAQADLGVDESLLGVIRAAFTGHVVLDLFLFAPAVAIVLHWCLRRGAVFRRPARWLALAYLAADVAETALTWWIGHSYLQETGQLRWTTVLITLSALKWLLLLAAALVAAIAAGVRQRQEHGKPVVLISVWRLRAQVVVVLFFGLLVAAPISGPLDQVPDLLRSTYDQPNLTWAKWATVGALVVLSALVWCTGQLVVAASATDPTDQTDPTGFAPEADSPRPTARTLVLRRLLVLGPALLVALLLGLVFWVATDTPTTLRSPAAYAFAVVVGLLLLADLALAGVQRLIRRKASAPDGPLTALPLGPRVLAAHRPVLARAVVALSVAPVLFAAVGLVRAYAPIVLIQVGDESVPTHDGAWGWLLAGAVSATLGTLALFWLLSRERFLERLEREPRWHGRALFVWSLLAMAMASWVSVSPTSAGRKLGAHGIVLVFLAGVVLVAGLLQAWAERTEPAPLTRLFGMQRNPWNLLLVVVFLLASTMDTQVGYHSVLLTERAQRSVPNGVALEDSLDEWYEAARACRGPDAFVPLVLVAAPGGGARGAYWTGQVMTEISDVDACRGDSVFAASGVSGGSVGLALWSATGPAAVGDVDAADRTALRPPPVPPIPSRVWEDFVSPDTLSATVGALLFRDVPRGFTGAHPLGRDRAALQQRLWEEVDGMERDFYAPVEEGNWRTRLILNASDLKTGCKVLVSQVRVVGPSAREVRGCQEHPGDSGQVAEGADALAAGAVDAHHYLDAADCPRNPPRTTLSLAGAALLSARFTYVSPIGAMVACGHGQGPPRYLDVADGGYLENTGIHTLLALWQDLEPLVQARNRQGARIVPVAVLVENHYRSPAALREPGRVRELDGPLNADRRALLQSPPMEQALATVFGKQGRRWYVVAPSVRPSVAAPLGWSLSQSARADLDAQVPDLAEVGPGSPLRGLRELLRRDGVLVRHAPDDLLECGRTIPC